MSKISRSLDKANMNKSPAQRPENTIQQPQSDRPGSIPDPLPTRENLPEHRQPVEISSANWDERLDMAVNDNNYLPEVFKTLRSRILHPLDGQAIPRTIMVTSAIPKEGKSFVSANLGISLAHGMDQHCMLVDCDLRKPTMAKLFGLDNRVGLVDYLRDDVMLSELIAKTTIKTLSVLPSGKSPANPAELLGSSRMAALVDELSERYEDRIIIFDSPPLLLAAETSVLAGQVDAVILVVRQSGSGKAQIQKILDVIGTERILGIVFNDQDINPLQESIVKGYGSYHSGYY